MNLSDEATKYLASVFGCTPETIEKIVEECIRENADEGYPLDCEIVGYLDWLKGNK